MNALSLRWPATVVVAALFSLLVASCVVPGGGYYDQGYGLGYYEPVGMVVGGWGEDYHVGPWRGGGGFLVAPRQNVVQRRLRLGSVSGYRRLADRWIGIREKSLK